MKEKLIAGALGAVVGTIFSVIATPIAGLGIGIAVFGGALSDFSRQKRRRVKG
ncbi:hypothetical protein [Arthrobacter sp. YN]|uniref:hypothetical protein n=1 Tax=Arthrobacter sp. YN TaxID=2020486 RepID=UPI0012FD5116|nr:hypothetical protein [Arthrobacter sp. YN]